MDHKRPDGRLPNELRDIIISFDGLDGVDGSARFGFGETKALATVSGPIEVRLAVEQASRATFEVIVRPLVGLAGTDSKALASALRSALEPSMILTNNPRTLIQLVALALTPNPALSLTSKNQRGAACATLFRTSPSLVAAVINAASLALLNASSVPLRGVVCAASVGRVRDTGGLIVDPAEAELASLEGSGVFAYLISGDASPTASQTGQKFKTELVWSSWNAAPFDEDELARVMVLARAAALRVREYMKDAISVVAFGAVKVKKEEAKPVDVEPLEDVKMEIS